MITVPVINRARRGPNLLFPLLPRPPPSPKSSIIISRRHCRLRIPHHPGRVLTAALLMQKRRVLIRNCREARNEGLRGQWLAEVNEMVEVDPFEYLAILVAGAHVVAEVFQDPVSAKSGPGGVSRGLRGIQRPSGRAERVTDKTVGIFEIGLISGAFPQAAKAGENDRLVVCVHHFVPLVALACADTSVTIPARHVEAINV